MRKILIVEDDILLNRTLGYNLASDGYEVTAAYNYKDAVSHLKAIEFDIALLDINLPDGSGLDLCEEIRGRGQHTYGNTAQLLRQALSNHPSDRKP